MSNDPSGEKVDIIFHDAQVLPIPAAVTQISEVVTKIAMGLFLVYFSSVELARELATFYKGAKINATVDGRTPGV